MFEQEFLSINPFASHSVGEREIWADDNDDFPDVPSINHDVFRLLMGDVDRVRTDGAVRFRFVVGTAGSGKSHVFSRLRRSLDGRTLFTFISNPPLQTWDIKRFILEHTVYGLKHPAQDRGVLQNAPQILRFIYTLLAKTALFRDRSPDQIATQFTKMARMDKPQFNLILEEAAGDLGRRLPFRLSLNIIRTMVRLLDDERRDQALEWLSGSRALSDRQLGLLDVGSELEDGDITKLLRAFGNWSRESDAGPIVMVLDQLDQLKQEQIEELLVLLHSLTESRNYYVVVSLTRDRFRLWDDYLTQALRERMQAGPGALPLAEILPVSEPDQKRQLVIRRLSSEKLRQLRLQARQPGEFYPLDEKAVGELTAGGPQNPRQIILKARDEYETRLRKGKRIHRLCKVVRETFENIAAAVDLKDFPVNTAVLADRVGELFEIVCAGSNAPGLKSGMGPLVNQSRGGFAGSDRVYEVNNAHVRVVGHDVQNRQSFPAVLKRLLPADERILLLRDGRVACSGGSTQDLLGQFQRDKVFIHVAPNDLRRLHALGRLLAKMREGDFNDERTDPEPTPVNIMRCLSGIDELMKMAAAREFGKLAGLSTP